LHCLVALLLLGCAGCGNVRFYVSRQIDLDAIESRLRLKESTREDVEAVLGAPEGKGREMLPMTPDPRSMWSYYYEEGTLQDVRRVFLFVYFDGDVFDGYFWVSSLPEDAGKGL
jgi:hypothetical protein